MTTAKGPNLISLGGRVKKRRLELKMTQSELARKAKLGEKAGSYISSVEREQTDISASKLLSISEALDTNVCYLLGLTDNPAMSDDDVRSLLASVPTPEEEPNEEPKAEKKATRPEVMRLFAAIASVQCR